MDTNFIFGMLINIGLAPSFQEFNSNNYTEILSEFTHETQAVSHTFLKNVFIHLQHPSLYTINDLASYSMTDFCSEKHTKSTNKFCWKIVKILMFE